MKPCIFEIAVSRSNRKPPTRAPTSPSAILTMQPSPCLPTIRLASQPMKAPNTIQPIMNMSARYFTATYIMVTVAAAITAVDSQPRIAQHRPGAECRPSCPGSGHEHHRRHHRHGDHAVEHRAPVQRLDRVDRRPVDAQSQQRPPRRSPCRSRAPARACCPGRSSSRALRRPHRPPIPPAPESPADRCR